MELQIIDKNNKKVGEIQLADKSFEKVNKATLYYAVKANLNNLRHGTSAVKERNQIHKSRKKIYRQKGTGNARHGERTANIFVGGGVVHGPRPGTFSEKINKKFKKVSYREVFKYLIQNEHLKVFKDISFDKPSTKEAAKILDSLKIKKVLVVLPLENKNASLSFRNLKDVKVISENNINIYEMLRYENVILTASYFENLKERYGL